MHRIDLFRIDLQVTTTYQNGQEWHESALYRESVASLVCSDVGAPSGFYTPEFVPKEQQPFFFINSVYNLCLKKPVELHKTILTQFRYCKMEVVRVPAIRVPHLSLVRFPITLFVTVCFLLKTKSVEQEITCKFYQPVFVV